MGFQNYLLCDLSLYPCGHLMFKEQLWMATSAWVMPGNNSVFLLDQVFCWVFCVDVRHLAKTMVAVIRLFQLPSKGPFNGWSCSYQKLGLRVVVDDVDGNHSIIKQRRLYCMATSGRCRAFFLTFFYLFLKCVRVLSLKNQGILGSP